MRDVDTPDAHGLPHAETAQPVLERRGRDLITACLAFGDVGERTGTGEVGAELETDALAVVEGKLKDPQRFSLESNCAEAEGR